MCLASDPQRIFLTLIPGRLLLRSFLIHIPLLTSQLSREMLIKKLRVALKRLIPSYASIQWSAGQIQGEGCFDKIVSSSTPLSQEAQRYICTCHFKNLAETFICSVLIVHGRFMGAVIHICGRNLNFFFHTHFGLQHPLYIAYLSTSSRH